MKNLKEKDLPESYKQELQTIRDAGFKPIAVATLICEITFCFETEEEAIIAHKKLEAEPDPSIIQAWWYGREEFLSAIEEDESKFPEEQIPVYWLDT